MAATLAAVQGADALFKLHLTPFTRVKGEPPAPLPLDVWLMTSSFTADSSSLPAAMFALVQILAHRDADSDPTLLRTTLHALRWTRAYVRAALATPGVDAFQVLSPLLTLREALCHHVKRDALPTGATGALLHVACCVYFTCTHHSRNVAPGRAGATGVRLEDPDVLDSNLVTLSDMSTLAPAVKSALAGVAPPILDALCTTLRAPPPTWGEAPVCDLISALAGVAYARVNVVQDVISALAALAREPTPALQQKSNFIENGTPRTRMTLSPRVLHSIKQAFERITSLPAAHAYTATVATILASLQTEQEVVRGGEGPQEYPITSALLARYSGTHALPARVITALKSVTLAKLPVTAAAPTPDVFSRFMQEVLQLSSQASSVEAAAPPPTAMPASASAVAEQQVEAETSVAVQQPVVTLAVAKLPDAPPSHASPGALSTLALAQLTDGCTSSTLACRARIVALLQGMLGEPPSTVTSERHSNGSHDCDCALPHVDAHPEFTPTVAYWRLRGDAVTASARLTHFCACMSRALDHEHTTAATIDNMCTLLRHALCACSAAEWRHALDLILCTLVSVKSVQNAVPVLRAFTASLAYRPLQASVSTQLLALGSVAAPDVALRDVCTDACVRACSAAPVHTHACVRIVCAVLMATTVPHVAVKREEDGSSRKRPRMDDTAADDADVEGVTGLVQFPCMRTHAAAVDAPSMRLRAARFVARMCSVDPAITVLAHTLAAYVKAQGATAAAVASGVSVS